MNQKKIKQYISSVISVTEKIIDTFCEIDINIGSVTVFF